MTRYPLRSPTHDHRIRRARLRRRSTILAAEHCLWCWCQGLTPAEVVAPFGRNAGQVSHWGDASEVLAAAWRLAMWRSRQCAEECRA